MLAIRVKSFLKLLSSPYSQIFKNLGNCQRRSSKVNSIDLICKQEALNGDPKAIQYYFTRNLDHAGKEECFFFGEMKRKYFRFLTRYRKV